MKTVKHFFVIVVLVAFTVMAQVNITVMTYNIFGGKDVPEVGRVVDEQSPDFLGIQESKENQIDSIANASGMQYAHWAAPGRTGEAVLSTYPLSNFHEIVMSTGGGAQERMLLISETEITNSSGNRETLVFLTTHFVYQPLEERIENTNMLIYALDSLYGPDQLMILTGDLNSKFGEEPIEMLENDNWEIADFDFFIDWIMYRPADRWDLISVEEIPETASDHDPVVMKLSLGGTGISNNVGHNNDLPIQFSLVNNSNCYNSPIMLQFKLAESSIVSLKIFDLFGRMVKTLYNGQSIAGNEYTSIWDFTNENREMVNAGKYLCVLQAGSQKRSKQIVVIK